MHLSAHCSTDGLTGPALVQRKDQEAEPLYRLAMKIAMAMDVKDDLQCCTRLSDLASLQAKQVCGEGYIWGETAD